MEFVSPALEELLPDLSRDEQLRLQKQSHERERIWKRTNKNKSPPLPPTFSERQRDSFMVPHVHYALRHYNARHPGGEFDAVKPLMYCSVPFRGHPWFHVNFWARSRRTNKISRFFAEVHYRPPPLSSFDGSAIPVPIPTVELCTILEEPLSQYRSSYAFCTSSLDILHPKGSRKFVCGNDKHRIEQRLPRGSITTLFHGMPFTGS
nr:unnamed protein product [Digitaria exilis]